jgi:dTDP-4-dehydrorhamnose 3,5-epimerase-like enzyme
METKTKKLNYKVMNFKVFGDERGFLTPIECMKDIPFDVKRIFYIYGTMDRDTIRGDHANRNSSFVLIMLSGACKIKIYNNKGSVEEVLKLNSPKKGLFLDKMIWKEMYDFTENSVMLVLSSHHFDKHEYIDTYEEFLKEVNGN